MSRPRGFAAMDAGLQRRIASSGGKAAHLKGTAHRWTANEAREAGRKGGLATRASKDIAPDDARQTQEALAP